MSCCKKGLGLCVNLVTHQVEDLGKLTPALREWREVVIDTADVRVGPRVLHPSERGAAAEGTLASQAAGAMKAPAVLFEKAFGGALNGEENKRRTGITQGSPRSFGSGDVVVAGGGAR